MYIHSTTCVPFSFMHSEGGCIRSYFHSPLLLDLALKFWWTFLSYQWIAQIAQFIKHISSHKLWLPLSSFFCGVTPLFSEHALLLPSFKQIILDKHDSFYGIIICTRNFLQPIREFLICCHHYHFILLVRPHYSTLVLTKVPHKATCLSHQMPPHLPLIIPSHSYLNTIKTSLTHSHKLHTELVVKY